MERVVAGDYRIVKPLSEGGMGSVFVAEQISTGRRRALKLMKPELSKDVRFRERFGLEAKVGSRIESEHIVEVVGAGIDDASGSPWLAMELLDGEDLAGTISRRGALPSAEVTELLRQVGHALSKAHEAGIVHRDLKPENLFVAKPRRDGVPFTLKILDFGIAKLVSDANSTGASATASLGTPLWMAPEQADAKGVIGPGADIWPLGLITYYALTGRHYWRAVEENASVTALLKEVLFEPLEPPSLRARSQGVAPGVLPAGFDAWFLRCVERAPQARFGSARETVESFAALSVSGLAAGALAATVAQLPSTPPPALAPTQFASAPPQPPPSLPGRRRDPLAIGVLVVSLAIVIPAAIWGAIPFLKPSPSASTKEELAAEKRLAKLITETNDFVAAEDAPIPITKDDPAMGTSKPFAVGTLFCGWRDDDCVQRARVADTVIKSSDAHIRIVYKHAVPRDDHDAYLAAQALQGAYESAGVAAFTKLRDSVFAHRGEVTRANLVSWAQAAGVLDPAEFGRRLDEGRWKAHVDRDGDLAARLRLSTSSLLVNCSEPLVADINVYVETSAPKKELLALAASNEKFHYGFSDFHPYKTECAKRAKDGPLSFGPSTLARSRYGTERTDDAARNTVLRLVIAQTQADAAVMETLLADPVKVNGKEIARAKLIAERAGKTKPAPLGVFNTKIEPHPDEPSSRIVLVQAVSRASKAPPQLVEQRFRVERSGASWRVVEEFEATPIPIKACEWHVANALLTSNEVLEPLFQAPTREERDEGCLARVVDVTAHPHRGYVDVACYQGMTLRSVRRFELDVEKGAFWVMEGNAQQGEKKTFSNMAEVRAACPNVGTTKE